MNSNPAALRVLVHMLLLKIQKLKVILLIRGMNVWKICYYGFLRSKAMQYTTSRNVRKPRAATPYCYFAHL